MVNSPRRPKEARGFALVTTLVLLALLVVAAYSLSALNRIGVGVAAGGAFQVRARQHALLALDLACAELQRTAGPDAACTGIAGLNGIGAGAGQPARHWCGVWDGSGGFQCWLVSGVVGPAIPSLGTSGAVTFLGAASLGADGADKEHVRVPVVAAYAPNRQGAMIRQGDYAWWVGDEGVKLSARLADDETPLPGGKHAVSELIVALSPIAPHLAAVEAFSQLALVTTPWLTPGQLQSNFHALTVTHSRMTGAATREAGLLNVNSTSARYWRGVAATYNQLKPAEAVPLSPAAFGTWMRDHMGDADAVAGKAAGQPYVSTSSFLGGDTLAGAIASAGGEVDDFAAVMGPWLVVRSDTFRIRAYGSAVNPADESRVEAVAWCEAVVQRTYGEIPGFGRRFVVVSFRWLGPDDL
jgi:hypothetical protein